MYKKYKEELNVKNEKYIDKDLKRLVDSCWEAVDKQCRDYKPPMSPTNRGDRGWKVVRVFVSSTFTDFFNERELLVKKVFPELREWCHKRHLQLIECDLRWGVPKEATSEEVIQTCLEELNRCHEETNSQPFFIGLLGKRYGWIPGVSDISTELKQKLQWVDNTSITFMEILHGAYRCRSPNAAFFIRSDDVLKSVPEKQKPRFVDCEELNQQHLEELHKRVRETFPGQVFDYSCSVDGTEDMSGRERVKFSNLDNFCDQALEFLKKAITNMYDTDTNKTVNEDDIEEENQRLYVEDKAEFVVGQDLIINKLRAYLNGDNLEGVDTASEEKAFVRDPKFWGEPHQDDSMIMCVKGPPGYGKSCILATVVRDCLKKGHDIFYHFVGCSATSKKTEFFYERLINCLRKKISDSNKEPMSKINDKSLDGLKEIMKSLLPKLQEQKIKLYIIIDAVNELQDAELNSHLSWLPPKMPSNIKCIISAADTHPPSLLRLTEHESFVTTVAPLTKESAKMIGTHSLQKFNKKLDEEQLEMIVSNPCATNPLWLTIMLEELRVFGDFRTLNDKISRVADSVESLLNDILNRIVSEDNSGLVKKALCLLACSNGSIQLLDLCNMLGDITNKEPVPALYWSRTRRVLSPFIKEIGVKSNISFYHLEISKAVTKILVEDSGGNKEWIRYLGLYYTKWCPDLHARALHAPNYCYKGNMDTELIEFLHNDPATVYVYDYQKSQLFQRIRCRFLTHNQPEKIPVVICQTCSMKPSNPNRTMMFKDSCVICRSRIFYAAKHAYLCNTHGFGQSRLMAKCYYCKRPVSKDKDGNVQKLSGMVAKLCQHCSFGNFSQICVNVTPRQVQ